MSENFRKSLKTQ